LTITLRNRSNKTLFGELDGQIISCLFFNTVVMVRMKVEFFFVVMFKIHVPTSQNMYNVDLLSKRNFTLTSPLLIGWKFRAAYGDFKLPLKNRGGASGEYTTGRFFCRRCHLQSVIFSRAKIRMSKSCRVNEANTDCTITRVTLLRSSIKFNFHAVVF
jgi:hypothetical protein